MPPKSKGLNPVFVSWLEESRDELDPESKYRTVYNRAIKSMTTYPKYFEHPKECVEVKFVGPKLRDQLIKKHNERQGITSGPSHSLTDPPSSQAAHNLPTKANKGQFRPSALGSSSDESEQVPLSQQSRISSTLPPDPPTPEPAARSIKKVPKLPRATSSKAVPTIAKKSQLLSSSDSEPDPTSSGDPSKPKALSQVNNVTPIPRGTKSTKPAPVRRRLSGFVPPPTATSDGEPDSDHLDVTKNIPSFSNFEPIVFPAGAYTIQFILDEREVKSTKNRDHMLNGLKKRNVDVVKRALEVGDMCWVARLNGHTSEDEAECVLDYIVERKRMDDLKGSILDGRFHEQKFRLKHSGISHVYYLVEDYDTERIVRVWKEQINTALSSTQVVDGFFLKETTSIEDTLDYLASLHGAILKIYENKSLYIIPPQLVKRYNFLALKKQLYLTYPERIYHTTYLCYQKLNRKDGFYTLQDCMARMLQCIKGLSEEKIAALIEHYPTPRSLYEAFVEAEKRQKEPPTSSQAEGKGKGKAREKTTAPAPESILADLGDGGRRKIGQALSKHIYQVFMDRRYEL